MTNKQKPAHFAITKDPIKAFNISIEEDIWIFAYGSLMWNPEFTYEDMQPASISGYHRRFCLKCDHHRGKPENHGLVLGLDRGGSCRGVAFKISREHLHDALEKLWAREMWVEDAYLPKRIRIKLRDGSQRHVEACVFISNKNSSYYYTQKCRKQAADIIIKANGHRGSNFEYLERTVHQLRAFKIHDKEIEDIYSHSLTAADALLT